jgi:heptosyltransferase-3
MRRCLVLHPGALGDVLLAVPALGHLGALGFSPTLAVTSRLVPLFAASGLVSRAIDLETLGLHRLFHAPPPPGALERLEGYEAVVSWFGAGEPAYRANLAALACPVVLARAAPPPGTVHVSDHLLATLAPLGPVPGRLPQVRLDVAEEERAAARAWLAARGIEPGEAAVLQPGAGAPAKAWPGFGVLARRLRRDGFPVVVLVGPADAEVMGRLLAEAASGEAAVARDWPLARLAALLALARVAVGNDSGPTHLAAAVGCATVAVFGPTDPATWAPVGLRVRVIAGARGEPPWAGVDVDRVEAAIRALTADRDGIPASRPREPV